MPTTTEAGKPRPKTRFRTKATLITSPVSAPNKGPKQVNQTLNHLKSIQSYLENKAGEICHNMTRDYRDR